MGLLRHILPGIMVISTVIPGLAQLPLTVDPTFQNYTPREDMETFWYWDVHDIALRPDGNILVVGSVYSPGQALWYEGGVVMDAAGAFVPSAIEYMPARRIHEFPTGGYFIRHDRFLQDLSPDPSFDGTVNYAFGLDTTWDMANDDYYVYPDSSVLFVGGSMKRNAEGDLLGYYGLFKTDKYGRIDPAFPHRTLGSTDYGIFRMHPLSNGQFLLSGYFPIYDDQPVEGCFIRVDADGRLDTTFHFPASRGFAAQIIEQPDGKVILAGAMVLYDGPDTLKVIRVHTDGSLDPTFNNHVRYRMEGDESGGLYSSVEVLQPLDEERYLVGGAFTHADGEPRGSITCIDTAGNLLDCWAGGGLLPGEYAIGSLIGSKVLPNGDHYIFGNYGGIVDEAGTHLEQLCITRLYGLDVGINDGPVKGPWAVAYPNPGNDRVQFHFSSGFMPVRASVLDVRGVPVLDERGTGLLDGLDAWNLTPGLYTIRLQDAVGERVILKWLKT